MPTPVPAIRPASVGQTVESLVTQLGQQTRLDPSTGLVALNQPLMDRITQCRERALPALSQTLTTTDNPLTLHETLLTLEQMKRAGVIGVDHLYPVASRLNDYPHPLVQIALAHFYSSMDLQCPFGPSVVGLVRSADRGASDYPYPSWNPAEAWGHAVSEQMSRQNARATVRALVPVLAANGLAVPPQTRQWLASDTWAGLSG